MYSVTFVETVRKMRQAQKEYFHDRMQENLIAAKQLEKLVDDALAGTITFDLPKPEGTAVYLDYALSLIKQERIRQDIKWGAERMMDDQLWQAVLSEEVGEAAEAILKGLPTLEKEILHVAAVAVAWMENIWRRKDPISQELAWKERYFLDIDPEDSADDEISTIQEDNR